MKSVLYVGAALMIGASIYGFVDYRNTNHRKEFKEMYQEKEVSQSVDQPSAQSNPMSTEKTEVASNVPLVSKNETTKKESVKVEALPAAKKTIVKEKQPTSKIKKAKRKLNYKSFSRAPLREEIEMEKTTKPKKTTSEATKL